MNEIILPDFLKEGDTVAIVSPCSKVNRAYILGAKSILKSWGLKVIIGRHAYSSSGTFAGGVGVRLEDLQNVMDCERVKAILCSRGGYGAIHLIENINFTEFSKHPKWLIGFSDITALHYLFQKKGYASLHSLMARHLALEDKYNPSTLYLKDMLFGNIPTYQCETHPLNTYGDAKGILRGGNLAVAYGLKGTPYDIPAKGTILFIEDVGERPHAIERMLYNLKLSGVLKRISGLIIGQFTEYTEDYSLGKALYPAIADLLKEYHYPICFNFPVGHVTKNYPLIEGAPVEFHVGRMTVELKFNIDPQPKE